MHVARLCLMLADHHYSSIQDETRRQPWRNAGYPLYANTIKNNSYQGVPVLRWQLIYPEI